MKKLLEVFLHYFEMLYLDPAYRISDSTSSGSADSDASMVITGPNLTWRLVNNRGQFQLAVAPTHLLSPENWFWLSVIREYLDGDQDTVLDSQGIAWLERNIGRVAQLFETPSSAAESCEALNALKESIAERSFGPA